MIWAKDKDGNRILASKGATGYCPTCQEKLVAKCGRVVTHHWAHYKISDCDPWKEGETEWHRKCKAAFPQDWQEVTMTKQGKTHRADILTPDGIVIEFQHSSISVDDIEAREEFWGNVIWVIDAREPYQKKRLFLKSYKGASLTNYVCYCCHKKTAYVRRVAKLNHPTIFVCPRCQREKKLETRYAKSYARQLCGVWLHRKKTIQKMSRVLLDVGESFLWSIIVWRSSYTDNYYVEQENEFYAHYIDKKDFVAFPIHIPSWLQPDYSCICEEEYYLSEWNIS